MRVFLSAALAFVVAGAAALADPVPQLHDVTGVASNDVLNIRAEPTARAPIIGALAPNARGIEVTALNANRTWGRINTGEGSGWVSMRYMAARGVHIDNYNLPVGMRCFGTEPYWSLRHENGTIIYAPFDSPDTPAQQWELVIAQDTGIADDFRRMIRAQGSAGMLTAFVYPGQCSDGMSDRLYGLSLALMPGNSAPLLSGCCSLAPPN